jgi:hypothetical protein
MSEEKGRVQAREKMSDFMFNELRSYDLGFFFGKIPPIDHDVQIWQWYCAFSTTGDISACPRVGFGDFVFGVFAWEFLYY